MSAFDIFGDPFDVRPTDVVLHYYQQEAKDAVKREFAKGVKNTLVVMATGTGKTILMGDICRGIIKKRKRVLLLAHLDTLVQQAVETLTYMGLDPSVEKAESYARAAIDSPVVVASVQTMKGKRLESWPKDYFDLVMVDEAHHICGESYKNILKHFDSARVLGVTATPERTDGKNLGEVFESVAYQYGLWKAIQDPRGPFLSKIEIYQQDIGVDLREIRTVGKDFSKEDLEEAIKPHVVKLANATKNSIGDRKTIIFTPDVASATAFASAFNGDPANGIPGLGVKAEWISGDRPDKDEVRKRFKNNEFQVLVNCQILAEGFDDKAISAVVLLRPTKSLSFLAQMIGRGTRLFPGKDKCRIVDFNWITKDIVDIAKPYDLIQSPEYVIDAGKMKVKDADDAKIDAKLKTLIERVVRGSPGIDLSEAVSIAKRRKRLEDDFDAELYVEVEDKKRTAKATRQTLRIEAKERKVGGRVRVYDPIDYGAIGVFKTLGETVRKEATRNEGTITDSQKEQLQRITKGRMPGIDKLSKRRASVLIGIFHERRRLGLATYGQINMLARCNVPPDVSRTMGFDEASAMIDKILKVRKKSG